MEVKKGDPGTNMIMAVLGDANNVYSFHRMYSQGGTDLYRFYCFMRDLITDLGQVFPNRSFCYTMDNLNIHKHFIIRDLIAHAVTELYIELHTGPVMELLNTCSILFILNWRWMMV